MHSNMEALKIAVTIGTMKFQEMRGLSLDEMQLQYKKAEGNSPVGIMDLTISALMDDLLAKLLPGVQIYDEENPLKQYDPGKPLLYVDPVDGSMNAARGLHCSVQGVTVYDRGEFVATAVGNALEQTITYAEKGCGAFCQSLSGGEPVRLKVSTPGKPHQARVALIDSITNQKNVAPKLGFRQELAKSNWAVGAMNTREYASHIYMWCELAAGRAEMLLTDCIGFAGDFGPGVVLLGEAGGVVTDLDGKTPGPDACLVLGSNGEYHAGLLKAVQALYQGYKGYK